MICSVNAKGEIILVKTSVGDRYEINKSIDSPPHMILCRWPGSRNQGRAIGSRTNMTITN